MRKNFFKNTTFVLFTGAVALACLYYVLFYFVQQKNIAIATASVDQLTKEKQQESAESVQKALLESENDIDLINNYFVGAESTVSFIEYVEDLARQVNVDISIQNVEKVDIKTAGKELLRFKLAVQGNWKGVYRYTALLEEIPYDIILQSAELRKTMSGEILPKSEVSTATPEGKVVKAEDNSWRGDFEFTVLKFK